MPSLTHLPELVEKDDRVRFIIDSELSHVDAAIEINMMEGYNTSESSVRRARKARKQVQEHTGTTVCMVLPDFQCDLQDDDFLWRVYELANDLQPDRLYHAGDENDASTISRWVEGLPEEHDPGSLQRQVDVTYNWLKRFRDIPSVQSFEVAYSNHGHRFGNSLRTRVPGWKDMRVVSYEHIMREAAWYHGHAEPLDIEFDVPLITSIPGVILGHGDQWGLTSRAQYTQMTAVAKTEGRSVIAGHTHRPMLAGVAFKNERYVQDSRWVMNVGNAMNVERAEYMKVDRGKTPEWGQSVGVVTVVDGVAHPELVIDTRKKMFFRGRVY